MPPVRLGSAPKFQQKISKITVGFFFLNLQGNLRPEPREWYHSANDFELKIPKSAPLTYAQLPFYLDGLYDTADITAVIAQIRDICQKFEERGLPNYPSG